MALENSSQLTAAAELPVSLVQSPTEEIDCLMTAHTGGDDGQANVNGAPCSVIRRKHTAATR